MPDMKKLGMALAALLIASGCGSNATSAKKPDPTPAPKPELLVGGAVELTDFDGIDYSGNGRQGTGCSGSDGYDDLIAGAQVVVRDSAGKSVGLGELTAGTLTGQIYDVGTACKFSFYVGPVDSSDSILSVEVGNRGQVQFKREDSEDLALTIG